jgi:signal transduction histidine kinase
MSKISESIVRFYQKQTITSQIISTIVLFFIIFFLFQLIINSSLFPRYYDAKEIDRFTEKVDIFQENLLTTEDRYDVMFDFVSENAAYSIITNRNFDLINSQYEQYTFEMIEDDIMYEILVPLDIDPLTIGEEASVRIKLINNEIYELYSLETVSTSYSNNLDCENDCLQINGQIETIKKPVNLNYLYRNLAIVDEELMGLKGGSVSFDYTLDESEWYYVSDTYSEDRYVFIRELDAFEYLITIVPRIDTANVISIISGYSIFIYILTIFIIILWSNRLKSIVSVPISKIVRSTEKISALDFDISLNETSSLEVTSLSNSVNKIAHNLKETLNLVNSKNKELQKQRDQQEKQAKLRKQLVSSISHELKTPLMIIQLTIQGILDGIIDSQTSEDELENVIIEIEKSSKMIQDLLQIYRLEESKAYYDFSEVDLAKLTNNLLKTFISSFKTKNITLEIDIPNSPMIILSDESLMEQVVSNFITNAIKYTPNNQKIYCSIKEFEDGTSFELINYGITINTKDIDKIWLPFYRAQSSKDHPIATEKGSGIGLFLVSEILSAHENVEFGIQNIKNGVKSYFKFKKSSIK